MSGIEVAPKTYKLELSNGRVFSLHEYNAFDVIEWDESGFKTDSPDQAVSFRGRIFMVWLAVRDRDGQPTFEEFAKDVPISDLADGGPVTKALEFVNVPFTDSQTDTSTGSLQVHSASD